MEGFDPNLEQGPPADSEQPGSVSTALPGASVHSAPMPHSEQGILDHSSSFMKTHSQQGDLKSVPTAGPPAELAQLMSAANRSEVNLIHQTLTLPSMESILTHPSFAMVESEQGPPADSMSTAGPPAFSVQPGSVRIPEADIKSSSSFMEILSDSESDSVEYKYL
jgi:hypothetical protein